MPVLQASGYAVPVAPTVDPLPAIPDSGQYQNIRAPLMDSTARGLESFSTDLAKAANSFDNIEALHDQMIVDKRRNEFDNFMNNTLHGDPAVDGDVGYMGLQGENATAKREEVRKGIDAKLSELQKGFTNQRQLHAFMQETNRSRNIALSEIGQHYDQQYQKVLANTAEATRDIAIRSGQNAANTNNFAAFSEHMFRGMEAAEKAARAAGASPETIQNEREKVREKLAADWASKAIERNPLEAQQFIKDNRQYFGAQGDELARRADAAALEYSANQVISGQAAGQPSNLVRGGAIQGQLSKGGWLSVPEMVALAEKAGFKGEAARTMGAIAYAESQGNPDAHNPVYPDDSYGITQINALAHGEKAKAAKGNPQRAMELAFEVSKGGTDFSPWTTYTKGAHKQYLAAASTPTTGTDIAAQPAQPQTAQAPTQTAAAEKPAAPSVVPAGAPKPGEIVMVGDSLAGHGITFAGGGGKTNRNTVGVLGPDETAVNGWKPDKVLEELILNIPNKYIVGKNIALSSGISNSEPREIQDHLKMVGDQIDLLKERKAGKIVLMGVGTHEKLKGVNDALAKIAQEKGVPFVGPQVKTGSDQIHSDDKPAEMAAVQRAFAAAPTAEAPTNVDTSGGTSTASTITPPTTAPAPLEIRDKTGTILPIPPNDTGGLPDNMVPGLNDALRNAAQNLPPNPSPQLWNRVVQKLRVDYNGRHSAEKEAYAAKERAQKENDQVVGNQFRERMYPGSPKMPAIEEIQKDKTLSTQAKDTLTHLRFAMDRPEVAAGISANNANKLFERMVAPDGTEGQITSEAQIDKARIDGEINYSDWKNSIDTFRDRNSIKEAEIQNSIAKTSKAYEHVINPYKSIIGAETIDPEAPLREQAFVAEMREAVKEYRKAGKNPRELFDPGSATKPNPNYLGNLAQTYTQDAWKSSRARAANPNAPAAISPEVLKMPLNDLPQVLAAWKAGRFGRYGSPEAEKAAKEFAISKKFVTAPGGAPAAGGVPVR